MDTIIDEVMLAREEDRQRFKVVIEEAIEAGEENFGDFMGDSKRAPSKAAAAAAKKRSNKAAKEAIEAEELLQEIQQKHKKKTGSEGSLAELILSRNQDRSAGFDRMVSDIESRYKKTKTKTKK